MIASQLHYRSTMHGTGANEGRPGEQTSPPEPSLDEKIEQAQTGLAAMAAREPAPAVDLDLRLDAAYQPLLAVEAELRKRGNLYFDQGLTNFALQIWSVVKELERIRDLITDDGSPSLEAWLVALLDEVGVPKEIDGKALTPVQRHAHMMGRYAQIISEHRVALLQAEQSQRGLLAQVRKAARYLTKGDVAKATARLNQVVTVDTASKAIAAAKARPARPG